MNRWITRTIININIMFNTFNIGHINLHNPALLLWAQSYLLCFFSSKNNKKNLVVCLLPLLSKHHTLNESSNSAAAVHTHTYTFIELQQWRVKQIILIITHSDRWRVECTQTDQLSRCNLVVVKLIYTININIITNARGLPW